MASFLLNETITTIDEALAYMGAIKARPDFHAPAAYGIGFGTYTKDNRLLDVHYLVINGPGEHTGVAALFAKTLFFNKGADLPANGWVDHPTHAEFTEVLRCLEPWRVEPLEDHPNLRAIDGARAAGVAKPTTLGGDRDWVVCWVNDLDDKPASAEDVWLRLHLLSQRKAQPNSINLDGAFGLLTNVAWTNHGPIAADELEAKRYKLLVDSGGVLRVTSQDKFPPLLDYVSLGNDVRIADGARVRLGAYLSPGTVVMQAGFVNANAGTLGPAMVEGRVSMGVVLGADTDIGGGAGIIGTLSGGGTEKITLGEHCLLGANAELGISLGDRCTVQAGLAIMPGTEVHDYRSDESPIPKPLKAWQISGQSDLLIKRRNGHIGVFANTKAAELNAALHGGVIPEPTAD